MTVAAVKSILLTFSVFVANLFPIIAAAHEPSSILSKSQPGFHRTKVGEIEVIALSDGTVSVDTSALITKRPEDIERLLKNAFKRSPVDLSINSFLFQSGNKVVLVDAGVGELYGPSGNKLPQSIKTAGYDPEQITDILISHIHPDHIGGMMQGPTKTFPNARIHVDKKEIDYWLNISNKAVAKEDHKGFFDAAQVKFKPYVDSGQVQPFEGSVLILPGVRSIPAPGHTPGHSFFSLETGGHKLVFLGDALHIEDVQFPDPSVKIQFDTDPAAAQRTREQAFAEAAAEGYLVAATHISFPGIGHIRRGTSTASFAGRDRVYRELGEYRFYPTPYINNASSTR